jgi:hypothetical protein
LFYDRELKEKPDFRLFNKSPRQVMQSFGTDWGRQMINPNIWVYPVEKLVKEIDYVVVSDVRFINEVEMIKKNNGVLWKIERPNNPLKIETSHNSENGIDEKYIDRVIHNIGTVDHIGAVVSSFLHNLERNNQIEGYYGA